ncbi:hypothetical protein GRJ2_002714200 [Grus japonensis]|uniref:Uncharacterized protein n=1 Tax=Grus japonensis TaxID=30415 RepID=A0ABC9XYT9_GRUJA
MESFLPADEDFAGIFLALKEWYREQDDFYGVADVGGELHIHAIPRQAKKKRFFDILYAFVHIRLYVIMMDTK